jgi:hypothetical protein
MTLWRRIAHDLRTGESLDAFVTAAVAIVLVILNLIGQLPQERLAGLTLAVLALLAIGTLVTRAKLESANNRTPTAPSAPYLHTDFPPSYVADLGGSGDVRLVGISLRRMLPSHHHAIIHRLKAGNAVQVLLVDPTSEAAALAEKRTGVPGSADGQMLGIHNSLALLRNISREVGGDLEVRSTARVGRGGE